MTLLAVGNRRDFAVTHTVPSEGCWNGAVGPFAVLQGDAGQRAIRHGVPGGRGGPVGRLVVQFPGPLRTLVLLLLE